MLKFVTLMNDISENPEYRTEHGLSFWIEYNNSTYLFDTGQSELFYENLVYHKLNFEDVDHIVLSHAHYDHTGGMNKIMQINPISTIHLGSTFWDSKYSKDENDYMYRGNDFTRTQMEKTNMSIHQMSGSLKSIDDSVYLVSDFNRNPYFERIDPKFFVKRENQFIPDNFDDEVVLCIDHPKGIIVFVGCGHPGIVNIIETVKACFNKPIYAIIGGFHLNGQDTAYIQEVTDYLSKNVEFIGTGHCSGDIAVEFLKSTFDEKYMDLNVGKKHKIE